MPVKAIEKVINGKQVRIVQFHAIKGIKVKAKLFKLLLPVFSPFVGSVNIDYQPTDTHKFEHPLLTSTLLYATQ